MMRIELLIACAFGSLVGLPLHGQALASRVAAAGDGAVSFHFTARFGVCGDGEHFVRTGRHQYHGSYWTDRRMEPCVAGPVQVRITQENGVATRVQYWVGPLRSRNARDLGAVSAPEAARYLLTIASRGSPSASAKAVMPAVLADSSVVWPTLLAIAKDTDTRSRGTRQEAMLWLSRFASGTVAGHRNDPLDWDDAGKTDEDDVKVHAVFVLSQLPRGQGISDLLTVARSNASPRVRGHAMFWLGQSLDPRAIELFESVLRS